MGAHPTAVVYDNVPGGAGHVLQLLQDSERWLKLAADVLHGSDKHHASYETACMDCILSADVFDEADMTKLQRKRAYEFLSNSQSPHYPGSCASDTPPSNRSAPDKAERKMRLQGD